MPPVLLDVLFNRGECKLVKAFKKRKHADDFLAGSVRIGTLAEYRLIEDHARRDDGEGQATTALHGSTTDPRFYRRLHALGHTAPPGIVFRNCEHSVEYPAHVFCATLMTAEALPDYFGEHRIVIERPYAFFAELTRAFQRVYPVSAAWYGPVSYDWNRRFDNEVIPSAYDVAFSKPERFITDREARCVFRPSGQFAVGPFRSELAPIVVRVPSLSGYVRRLA